METGNMVSEVINTIYSELFREGWIIVIVCYVVGSIMKNALPKLNNQIIVPVLSVLGALLAVLLPSVFAGCGIRLSITKGLICGWASTGIHQFIKAFIRIKSNKISNMDDLVALFKASEEEK